MPPTDAPGRSDLFQPGQSFGKFYLVQLIGEGGTSRVFKALQQPINRLVALKIPSFADQGNILTPDEFLSEATLMARLEHTHVVRIYDFGVQEDKAFICMEYVEGWNLLELTEARGPLSVSAVLAAGLQTLEGLLYAHSQGVLHLDLSPANVLVGKSGIAKLSDFGMAGKKFKASQGRIVGTPAFLSPEHVSGAPGTVRSDLFSFGSLLYFAATGRPLFDPGEGNTKVTQALKEIESARGNPPADRIGLLPHLLAKPVSLALQSGDPAALMRELRESWKKIEAEERPEAVLRRELELDGDPLAPGSATDDPLSEQDLRERYFRLREGGKHREAVALLEKALRRQPDNPLLRELLATPPAKAKSAPVTVLVGAAPAAAPPAAKPGKSRDGAALKYVAGLAGILAVTVGLLAWGKGQSPPGKASDDGKPAGSAAAAGATAFAPAVPIKSPDASAETPVSLPPEGTRGRKVAAGAHAAPAGAALSVRRPRSPAVAVSGPAGTKVTVDDTAEWISPGPAGGWPLTPGLVNITLTPPGGHRPISSSLFVSADTLYLLSLEADGGFSVTRKRR